MQHAGNGVVVQTVAGLDLDLRLYAAGLLAGVHLQQAVGIYREGDANARRARRHGRDAAQRKTRQAAAVLYQVALALHHVQAHGGLAVLVGGEFLRHGHRYGLIARDDALDQSAHGFDAQRERNHVQQQHIVRTGIAQQLVGLHGRAQCHDFVGVEVAEQGLAKKFGHGFLHDRHAR